MSFDKFCLYLPKHHHKPERENKSKLKDFFCQYISRLGIYGIRIIPVFPPKLAASDQEPLQPIIDLPTAELRSAH